MRPTGQLQEGDECFFCGRSSPQRLCSHCCERVLRGFEASGVLRQRLADRLPTPLKILVPKVHPLQAARRALAVFQLLRYVMLGGAIWVIFPLSRLIITPIHFAFQLRIPEPITVIGVAAAMVAGVAMGLRVGRRWHHSIVRAWIERPKALTQPLWVRLWVEFWHTFSLDPSVLFVLGSLLLIAFVFRGVFLPSQDPWRVPGLGVSLALLVLVACSVPGFLVGVFLYGDWIRPCAQSVKAKQRR